MEKPNLTIKPQKNPIFKGMPAFLKDPKNFKNIQRRILETLATNHTHSELLDYASCHTCTDNMLKRRKLLRELGFKNPAQYRAWLRVHEEIKRKFPLVDWEKKEFVWHEK